MAGRSSAALAPFGLAMAGPDSGLLGSGLDVTWSDLVLGAADLVLEGSEMGLGGGESSRMITQSS